MRLVCAVLVIVFGAAGCGGDTDIDSGKAERTIADGIEEQTATEDVTIDCPDGVKQEKNRVFECGLVAKGGVKATVKVTQVDDDGNVRWEVNP